MAHYAHMGSEEIELAPGVSGREVRGVYRFFDAGGSEPIQQTEPTSELEAIAIIEAWAAQFGTHPTPGWESGDSWLKCSYNSNVRKNYPGRGYIYSAARDAFIAPKPGDEWVLNEETCRWELG
jgi:hypothetical protein